MQNRPAKNREIPVFMRRVGTMLGQMRAGGTILCQMIFALTIHALSTARIYTMLILRALPAKMALLLTNETHGKLETVSNARLGAHPHRVACKEGAFQGRQRGLGVLKNSHLCCRS
jgi:hypothetical protein